MFAEKLYREPGKLHHMHDIVGGSDLEWHNSACAVPSPFHPLHRTLDNFICFL